MDDVRAAKEWALENLDAADPDRVGLAGWSEHRVFENAPGGHGRGRRALT